MRWEPRIKWSRELIASAGQRSIDIQADGFISLEPKTGLIGYYIIWIGITGDVTKELIRVSNKGILYIKIKDVMT
jgi:hypothetical protein